MTEILLSATKKEEKKSIKLVNVLSGEEMIRVVDSLKCVLRQSMGICNILVEESLPLLDRVRPS